MPQQLNAIYLALLRKHDLPIGTSLENLVTWLLHKEGLLCYTQLKVGPFRLDYAWPSIKVCLEVDGPMHRTAESEHHDCERDRFLRSHGWVVFRVDDFHNNIHEQVLVVCDQIRMMGSGSSLDDIEKQRLDACYQRLVRWDQEIREAKRPKVRRETPGQLGLFDA